MTHSLAMLLVLAAVMIEDMRRRRDEEEPTGAANDDTRTADPSTQPENEDVVEQAGSTAGTADAQTDESSTPSSSKRGMFGGGWFKSASSRPSTSATSPTSELLPSLPSFKRNDSVRCDASQKEKQRSESGQLHSAKL